MDIKLDEGFQFGLGAFETIAVEEGRPILLDRHLRRLERAAAFFGFGPASVRIPPALRCILFRSLQASM